MANACLRQTAKKYKERPGPPFPAQECADRIARGNDNHYYISNADSRGVHRWVRMGSQTRKASKKAPATYITHDNGGLPFAVIDYGSRVVVFRQKYDEDSEMYVRESKPVFQSPYKRIWVGKDPLGITYDWDPAFMTGNTILLQTAANRYVFIGERIYSFSLETGDAVVTYVSPVGNNDVPYPYIIGKTHTYLLLDGGRGLDPSVIPNEALDLKIDAYAQFYGHRQASKGRTLVDVPVRRPAVSSIARILKRKEHVPRV